MQCLQDLGAIMSVITKLTLLLERSLAVVSNARTGFKRGYDGLITK